MSNETMPEKIYENFVDGEGMTVRQIADAFPNIAIGELARDITELRRQNAALKTVCAEIVKNAPEDLSLLDTEHLEFHALNVGYRRAQYFIAQKLKENLNTAAIPAPSKAEVAREFLREIIPRAQKTQKYFQEIGFDKVKHDYVALNDIDYALSFAVAFKEVLKEWEDAENK